MILQDKILSFYNDYNFFPENESQFNDIKRMYKKLNAVYNSNRVYAGEVRIHNNRSFLLLKNILSKKSINLTFLKNNMIRCGLIEINSILEYLKMLVSDYSTLRKEVGKINEKILNKMEKSILVDTRAIFQLFTSNSKKEPINEIKNELNKSELESYSNILYFLENKFTSTSFFILSNIEIKLTHKFNQFNRNYIIQKETFQYFPLFGDYSRFDVPKIQDKIKILVVENLDTAINLCFLEYSKQYDIILCAGGKVNASQAFANIIELFNTIIENAEFYYFGDYDYDGFLIYLGLQQKLYTHQIILNFLIFNEDYYVRNLFLFGKTFQNANKNLEEKYDKYIQIIKNDNRLPTNILIYMKINLKYLRELEQNVLLFL
ncbi:MAG: DUF2220 family protein [Candidatus Lokiarchaeota archaeon]